MQWTGRTTFAGLHTNNACKLECMLAHVPTWYSSCRDVLYMYVVPEANTLARPDVRACYHRDHNIPYIPIHHDRRQVFKDLAIGTALLPSHLVRILSIVVVDGRHAGPLSTPSVRPYIFLYPSRRYYYTR